MAEQRDREKRDYRGEKKSSNVIYLLKKISNCGIILSLLNSPNYSGKYMDIHYLVLITFQCFETFHNKKENR